MRMALELSFIVILASLSLSLGFPSRYVTTIVWDKDSHCICSPLYSRDTEELGGISQEGL